MSAMGFSYGTKPLVLAKVTYILYCCYSEITTDMFPGYFRQYNCVFTYSSLFKTYVFSAVIPALIAFKLH